jgi:anti-anti-sigma regulatory factor
MPFSIVDQAGRLILKVEGAITIRHAQECATTLADDFEDAMPAGIDTAGLTDIDTCILQLLYSLRRSFPALQFENPSEVFVSAVDRCGMRRELLSAQEGL